MPDRYRRTIGARYEPFYSVRAAMSAGGFAPVRGLAMGKRRVQNRLIAPLMYL